MLSYVICHHSHFGLLRKDEEQFWAYLQNTCIHVLFNKLYYMSNLKPTIPYPPTIYHAPWRQDRINQYSLRHGNRTRLTTNALNV